VLALAEVLLPGRTDHADFLGPIALALGATVPLAFLRTLPMLTAVTVSAATLLGPPTYGRFVVCGLPALAAVLYTVGRQRSGRVAVLFAAAFTGYALAGG
ncbi:sensor histidine kinase, partial [Streptomyces sp. SID14478]|nr:sensor histidine kinase [Streptomyces sp. SID14478]